MKNLIKVSVMAIAMTFVSCNSNTKKEEKQTVETPIVTKVASVNIPAVKETSAKKRSVVFITGVDRNDKSYFRDAKKFFENQNNEIVETAFSLQEVLLWLNTNERNKPFSEIHIVTNNKLSQVQLETTIKGAKLTAQTLKESIDKGLLPKLDNVLNKKAKVIIHSAGLGQDKLLINELKQVFSTDVKPEIVASEYISIFGGKFTEHYLAKPYYAFYPTAHSPGRVDLSKEFAKKYPETDIDWLSAMSNPMERFQGDIYSYKFNVPVKWEIAYENDDEMPSFRTLDEMYKFMEDNDQISADLKELNIPIEKFRWYQTVKGEKLVIKGMATAVCVLKPVMSQAYPSEYMIPNTDNLRLYNRL